MWVEPAIAAERLILKYGPFRRSIPVSDLRYLADTGRPTPELAAYLRLAKQDPDLLRQRLTEPVAADPVQLDRLLNSPLGHVALDEASRILHTPARQADRQALRAALILSASQDQEITVLSTLENYPTPEVELDGNRMVQLARQFNQLMAYRQRLDPWVERLMTPIRSLLNIR
ncbi:alpha/beta hydrolase [Synechococcales cyanobacterium C]|uniref:Alpha/beta hydrolase n=2 Tax=Petrachloros TaxID=2918834 RepID=A0A8K1ZX54_9CYAN|nr:alpha/beta hydrolase [Petrachloros mirabilis ULC683]